MHLKSATYQIIDGILFRKNYDGVLLIFLEKEDAKKVITELHDGLLEAIFQEIRQPTRFSELDTIGPHYLRTCMPM